MAFREVAQFGHKPSQDCTITAEHATSRFARIAQNYAVPVSEFVRKFTGAVQAEYLTPQRPPGNCQRESAQESLVLFVAALCHAGWSRRLDTLFANIRVGWVGLPPGRGDTTPNKKAGRLLGSLNARLSKQSSEVSLLYVYYCSRD